MYNDLSHWTVETDPAPPDAVVANNAALPPSMIGTAARIMLCNGGGHADEAFEELSRESHLLRVSMLELAAAVVREQHSRHRPGDPPDDVPLVRDRTRVG